MIGSLLGNFLSNVGITPKKIKRDNSDFLKRRKLVIREFATVDPNNNLIRARIAKRLLALSRNETERKAARKFYKDEMELYNLKRKIKAVTSINEKLRLAREGRRLATKQQRKHWDDLINKLQKLKSTKIQAEKKKALVKKEDKSTEEVVDEKDSKEVDETEEKDDMNEAEEIDENDDDDEDDDDGENDNEDLDTDNDESDEKEKTDGVGSVDDDLNLTGIDATNDDEQNLI